MVLTDDPAEALALADRLAVIDLGRIIQVGPARELYNRPVDVFVARLLGPTNLLQGQVESDRIDPRGEVVVRTPLGRLIGQSHPTLPAQGHRSRSRSVPKPCRSDQRSRRAGTASPRRSSGSSFEVSSDKSMRVDRATGRSSSQRFRISLRPFAKDRASRSRSRRNTSWSCRASSRSERTTRGEDLNQIYTYERHKNCTKWQLLATFWRVSGAKPAMLAADGAKVQAANLLGFMSMTVIRLQLLQAP